MRKWLIFAALVLVGGGVLGFKLLSRSNGAYDLTTVAVEVKPLTMTVETSGTVEPLSMVEVGCEVTGKIIELGADHDQPVSKGQIICRIDPELAAKEYEQAQADYLKAASALADAKLARDEQVANLPVRTQQALAQKQEAEAALVDAEYNWRRVDELYKKQNASEAEWVLRKSGYLRAQSSLTAAQAAHKLAVNNEKILVGRAAEAITQAEAAVKLAQARMELGATRVDRCTIRSPIDGVVLRRYFDVGTTVIAALQTPNLFLLAPSLRKMRVSAKVGESDISHIEVGQKARFTIEAKQSQTFEGRILHKRSQPDIVNNVVTYTVLFEVDNPDGVLLPGLSVNVVIECVHRPTAPQIANAALRFKPPIDADQRQVLIGAAQSSRSARPTTDANGQPVAYCGEAYVWQFDEAHHCWKAAALWVGINDNVNTEVLAGAAAGERFVKKFMEKSSTASGLREAIKLASPDNRSL